MTSHESCVDAHVLRGVRPLGRPACDVHVANGVVVNVRPCEKREGLVLLPAFVDLHTHLREPGGEDAETVATGTRAAAAGGYSDVFAMANTDPTPDSVDRVQAARALNRRSGVVRVHQVASITTGLGGRQLSPIPELAAIGVRVFSDDGHCVDHDGLMREAMHLASAHDVVLAQHAQSSELVGPGQINEGFAAEVAGLAGWPGVGEEVVVARDVILAEESGAHLHVCHASTRRTVEILRWAKSRGVRVTAEVTPHHLLLTDELAATGDPRFKVNPPLRSAGDVQALREALVDGTIDAVATDHAPHPAHRKRAPWPQAAFGMIGLETALPVLVHALNEIGALSWERVATLMSRGPARIGGLSVPDDPFAIGAPATFALVDARHDWTIRESDGGHSRSTNTPFGGHTFTHRVVATMLDGHLVHGSAAAS